jgi:hypothetical protein
MIRAIFVPIYQDTLNINTQQPDTGQPVVVPSQQTVGAINKDSGITIIPKAPVKLPLLIKAPPVAEKSVPAAMLKPIKSREEWNSSGNFLLDNGLKDVVEGVNSRTVTPRLSGSAQPPDITPNQRNEMTYDWLLGIFLFLVVLFVWIRTFYSKFFSTLGNALLSYHLSLKLFEERNVLLQRVSIVLDFIYVIVFSVFLFEFVEYFGFLGTKMKGFNLFLLLLNIVMMYAILRTIVLRLTGSLFLARPLFSEYIHNTLVINKGLGIALFPVVVLAQYLPNNLIPVVLVLGFIVVAAAFILKSLRSYQIILRRDVLIFYLILYLCTLEILPLLLGFKFVKTLIQSN